MFCIAVDAEKKEWDFHVLCTVLLIDLNSLNLKACFYCCCSENRKPVNARLTVKKSPKKLFLYSGPATREGGGTRGGSLTVVEIFLWVYPSVHYQLIRTLFEAHIVPYDEHVPELVDAGVQAVDGDLAAPATRQQLRQLSHVLQPVRDHDK